ncbi:MAG TPA: hypothetical protein PL182_00160 [Pseudobdellovibrionaceae bacterium]|nr:hypothetical protein [Pseudobdellovibrionaceae bacterium]
MAKVIGLLFVAFLPFSAQAFSFLKCNTLEGRTLWASFGKRGSSVNHEVVYFPTEIVVFASRTQLQDRQVFDRTADALKVPVHYRNAALSLRFEAKGLDGLEQTEELTLHLYSPQAPSAFVGLWTTDRQGQTLAEEKVFCSVY